MPESFSDNSHLHSRQNTGALTPMRSKARCSTAMGRLCTGCLGNGMRASTVAVPPPPRVSGEQVSVHWIPSMGRDQELWPGECCSVSSCRPLVSRLEVLAHPSPGHAYNSLSVWLLGSILGSPDLGKEPLSIQGWPRGF